MDSSADSWPLFGPLDVSTTALLAIDMQVDFVGKEGWFDQLGIDLTPTRKAIEPLSRLFAVCRETGIQIIHTRESYRQGGWDIAGNVKWRSGNSGLAYGQKGELGQVLTRGAKGWQLIPELSPLESERVIDKPGKSAFWGTDLEAGLRAQGISALIVAGVTTDVCVQTTLRDACDLGFDCILASDACAASKESNHVSYIELLSLPTSAVAPIEKASAIIERIRMSAA